MILEALIDTVGKHAMHLELLQMVYGHAMYLSYCEWYMALMIGRVRHRSNFSMDWPPGIIMVLVAPDHRKI